MNFIYCPMIVGTLLGSILWIVGVQLNIPCILENGLESYSISGVLQQENRHLVIYILKSRVGFMLLFLFFTIVVSYYVSVMLYSFLFGSYYGFVVSGMLVKCGIKGFVYSFMCFFPHYLFYFIGVYLIGNYYFDSKIQGQYTRCNVKKIQSFFKIFVIFLFLSAGLIWEMKFQKNILKFFYQYIV